MIDRQHGEILFECDGCVAVIETGAPEFDEAARIARRNEWRFRRVGSEWLHLCPACRDSDLR